LSDPLRVEATGETVGEAKWNALRELELLAPSLDKSAVVFEVLSEGERGLLGIGQQPARVAASAPSEAAVGARDVEESDDAARLRSLLERVTSALGCSCRIEIADSDASLVATCVGDDLGRLIGRHGQTLAAVQVLAAAIVRHGEGPRRTVTVDAAGYSDRRRERLEELALRSAEQVRERAVRVALEPMTAAERKLIHTVLEHHEDITTSSEGAEPHRYVVIEPA
jgi:spoIIIJ-associated protein